MENCSLIICAKKFFWKTIIFGRISSLKEKKGWKWVSPGNPDLKLIPYERGDFELSKTMSVCVSKREQKNFSQFYDFEDFEPFRKFSVTMNLANSIAWKVAQEFQRKRNSFWKSF